MPQTTDYVINPYTNRKVKVGSRKYRDLINTGAIAEEYDSESDFELEDLDWKKPQAKKQKRYIDSDDEIEPEYESEIEIEEIKEELPAIDSDDQDEYSDLNDNDLKQIEQYVSYIRNNKNAK
jgi:hypothetical protein